MSVPEKDIIRPAARRFALDEYRDLQIYRMLASREREEEWRAVLEALARCEEEHFAFWQKFVGSQKFEISRSRLWFFRILRSTLGLIFTVKFLERHKKHTVRAYHSLLGRLSDENQAELQVIIDRESNHERELVAQFREDKVDFISSTVLGVNDGLIELTGALAGFTIALRHPALILAAGFITGIAASLSMAASAFMQARYEPGKNAKKAAVYTGLSYLMVVLLLVSPFAFAQNSYIALLITLLIALGIIAFLSFYVSVLFERIFWRQFGLMFVMSFGVAIVSFAIGLMFRNLSGIVV